MEGPIDWPTTDLLTHRVRATPEKTAVIDTDADPTETLSYREFDDRVDRLAARLDRLVSGSAERGGDERPDDVRTGDDRTCENRTGGGRTGDERADDDRIDGYRVGLLMGTRVAFAAVYFAAMRRGIQVVPLNVRETAVELDEKVDRTDLDALVCEAGTEDAALEVADCAVASLDEPSNDGVSALRPSPGAGSDTGSEGNASPVPLDRDRTHLVMFTSGTSGDPKGVRLTVGNLVASATASAFRLGVAPGDRWLCCLPMYHMGGLAPVVRSTLYGTTVVLQREFDPGETARVADDHEVTGVSLVPTMLNRLLDAGWSPPDSLRFVLLGGAPASSDLVDRCRDAGVPVYPTYGTTETASQVATATPDEAFAHEGTVGRPLAFTDVSVVSDGEGVPTGEPGELVVSGPTVTPGYLDDDRRTAAFDERGFHTGDVGYRDGDGRLWILNRRSDRIVTGGENVDPGEVVDALRTHPAVEDAAVVGLPDEEWGERVAALVVAPDRPSTEALLAVCEDRLAGFRRPKTIGFVDELPRTHSGTIDREAVRDRLGEVGSDVSAR